MNKCNIIKDLLPLYAENIASEDTKKFIEEHLKTCADCKAEYESMKTPEKKVGFEIDKPLKDIKKMLMQKKLMTVAASVMLTVAVFIIILTGLTAPKFIPYTEDLLTVTELGNDGIEVTVNDPRAEFDLNVLYDEETGKNLFFLSAWTTKLNEIIKPDAGTDETYKNNEAATLVRPNLSSSSLQIGGENIAVFYSQNNGEDDVLIYGVLPENFGSIRSLPRLFLGYYVIIAAIAASVLTAAGIIVKKGGKHPKAEKILSFIIPIPYLYVTANILLMPTGWATYSASRYLIAIISLLVILYWIMHLIIGIIRLHKETKS